ncbi:PfkB family carbohydrate kinase [Rhodoglobus sp. NPDC076762]
MNSAAPSGIVVVGSVNHDHFTYVRQLPVPGETVAAHDRRSNIGGKGANQAFAAARAGAAVTFVGQVGNDESGRLARQALLDIGINVEHLITVSLPTGTAHVTVEQSGENTVVIDPGANGIATAELAAAIAAATPTASVILAQGELPGAVIDALSHTARQLGIRFVLNLAPVLKVHPDTLATADPLIVNESEALSLVHDEAGAHPNADLDLESAQMLVAKLASTTGRSVVVTLGGKGVVASDGTHVWHQAAFTPPTVVDTTGAGDAFTGVLCAYLANGSGLPSAIRAGAAAGAIAVSAEGTTTSYPDLTELRSALTRADAYSLTSPPTSRTSRAESLKEQ